MLKVLLNTVSLLTPRERWLLLGLLAVSTAGAVTEVVGVISVIPFLAVAADPALIQSKLPLKWAYDAFGFDSSRTFLIVSGIVTVVMLVASNALNAFVAWYRTWVSHGITYNLAQRLFESYLGKEYTFYLQQNTAVLQKNVLTESLALSSYCLEPGSTVLARGLSTCFILIALAVFNWQVALAVIVPLGGIYVTVFVFLSGRLNKFGLARWKATEARTKLVLDALNGIKDVKMSGYESWFARQSKHYSRLQRRAHVRTQQIEQLPRFLVETLAFSAIVTLVVIAVTRGTQVNELIPILGLYAFAGSRLMPSMSQMYTGVAHLKFSRVSIERLVEVMREAHEHSRPIVDSPTRPLLHLRRELTFNKVSFVYPSSNRVVLREVDFSIPANTTVGFVGPSGAGKTTIMDLCLGLLRPREGTITVDGVVLDDQNVRAWQNNIGYVPQQIFLNDSSVAENIAFGIPPDSIDMAKVERAAKLAKMHDFVVSELPDGYQTAIGDRGIRLSGGQRQRIGIARALYNDPDVLFFDEATSSLDTQTEEAIVEAIRSMAHAKTILVIAHRISSLQGCEAIYVVKSGRIVRRCSYAQLLESEEEDRSHRSGAPSIPMPSVHS
jgi:ATP-binding cassette, subfamily B, bacterial PglK